MGDGHALWDQPAVALDEQLDFQILPPPGWWELPVTAADIPSAVIAVVDERLELSPPAVPDRDEIIKALVFATVQAQRAGAVYAAQIGAENFALSMIVTLQDIPPLRLGREPADLLALVRMLRNDENAGDKVHIEAITLGRLGAGVCDYTLPPASRMAVTYWFPVRGTSRTAMIRIASPTPGDAADLRPFLDDVISTVVIAPAARPAAD